MTDPTTAITVAIIGAVAGVVGSLAAVGLQAWRGRARGSAAHTAVAEAGAAVAEAGALLGGEQAAELARLRVDLDALRSAHERTVSTLAATRIELEEVRERLVRSETDRDQIHAEAHALRRRVEELERREVDLMVHIDHLESEMRTAGIDPPPRPTGGPS